MNEIRDPVHGYIHLNDDLLKIVNTPIFQRLRRIKQLAMAYLAYPSANHTRFEHSLGVYHVASLMLRSLFKNDIDDDKKRIVLCAALLHDVGHGPFSHVSESILKKYSSITDTKDSPHELLTKRIIKNDPSLGKYISDFDRTQIIKILSGESIGYQAFNEIVAGNLDADKIDYLLRDSYFCGVKYGIFDIERLLNILELYDDYGEKHFGINSEGINTLEQFVLAKYYMMNQVYRHKVRLITDEMIKRGIELGIEKDELPFLKKLYTYEDTAEYLERYTSYCDNRLINDILNAKARQTKEIFVRLNNRNLFKRIFQKSFDYLENNGILRDRLLNISDDDKRKIESKVATLPPFKRLKKEYIIVNTYNVKGTKEMSIAPEGNITVVSKDDKDKQLSLFQEKSLILRSINEEEKGYESYFEIYAPTDNIEPQILKIKPYEKDIIEIIKQMEE